MFVIHVGAGWLFIAYNSVLKSFALEKINGKTTVISNSAFHFFYFMNINLDILFFT